MFIHGQIDTPPTVAPPRTTLIPWWVHVPTALMMNPFGDLRALRIHASRSTSRLFAFPCTKSTRFSIHPWKHTSAIALTSLLFQKLRRFCALKSAKISWPLVLFAFTLPPPARKLSSSGPRTTASEAALSWTSLCCWAILKPPLSTPTDQKKFGKFLIENSKRTARHSSNARLSPAVKELRLSVRFGRLPGRRVTVAGVGASSSCRCGWDRWSSHPPSTGKSWRKTNRFKLRIWMDSIFFIGFHLCQNTA